MLKMACSQCVGTRPNYLIIPFHVLCPHRNIRLMLKLAGVNNVVSEFLQLPRLNIQMAKDTVTTQIAAILPMLAIAAVKVISLRNTP